MGLVGPQRERRLRLTVPGTSGARPAAGRACSGYLLESNGVRIVVDLGFGALPRQLAHCAAADVRAVLVSHAHADHCVDLFGLYRARVLPEPPFPPLPVYALPEVMDRVGSLDGTDGSRRFRAGCEYHETGPEQEFSVGPFRVRTVPLPHFVPDLGFRIESEGSVVAYTGDTGPSPRLVDLARDADLFVCEAMYQGAGPPGPQRFLLTAAESGRAARDAGARRLLLTHFWPGDDRAVSRPEAATEFRGEVVLAEEELSLSVP